MRGPRVMDSALSHLFSATPREVPHASFPHEGLALYGGGRLGKLAYGMLQKAGVQVSYIIDQNARALTAEYPVPVYTVEEAAQHLAQDVYVFDCVFKVAPDIAKTLLAPHGFSNIYTVYDLLYAMKPLHFTNGWQSGALDDADRQGITHVYEHLADEASRAAYLYNLHWRIARESPAIPGFSLLPESEKYFNPITRVPLIAGKNFLDVGSFDLFFTTQALDAAHNSFPPSAILAFEPDPESYARCERLLETLPGRDSVTVSPLALSEQTTQAQLIGNDLASRLIAAGDVTGHETLLTLNTTTLDAIGRELPDIGYIKLHVEGEELPCLKGGVACIAQHRPLIAVNCTHNRDGLWKIAHFVMEHTERYRYFFRAYAHYGEGLTFYAVPA